MIEICFLTRKHICQQCFRAQRKQQYHAAPDARRTQAKGWASKNRQRINANNRQRYADDPNYRLKYVLRRQMAHALTAKRPRTLQLLGCSLDHFRAHLEANLQPGMTMENHGTVWDMDHIIPISAWDLTKPEHVAACFHWTNIQPMLKSENRSKGGANRRDYSEEICRRLSTKGSGSAR